MWSILFPAAIVADPDALISELWEHGTAGIVEEPDGLRAFFEDDVEREAVAYVNGCRATEVRAEPPVTRPAEPENWDPILIGERFYLAPPGIALPLSSSRSRLEIEDSVAFGTGRHETTQLCIEALEHHLWGGDTLVDIGCGSGILSAAARVLGAGVVFSCDIDESAVATARRNAGTAAFAGSADAVRSGAADVVAANISAKVLNRLASELKRITRPGGLLILSGFIRERPPARFEPEEVREQGDWSCWLCRPEKIDATGMEQPGEGLLHEREWWL